MKPNALIQLGTLGQSIWLDYIRRDLIVSGELKRLIEDDGLRGMTSNPAIFETAIVKSHDYDEDIRDQTLAGKDAMAIYETISQRDVQSAADEFKSLHVRTDGRDGYVSLEVNPHLARNTAGTIEEARRLWNALNRPNVFIKVPATIEGLPAIQQLISEGINVNVTLIFGLPRYRQVAEAFIAGLEARVSQGKPVNHIASVASFFVSRIDTLIDPLLEKIVAQGGEQSDLAQKAHGQIAIASAKTAYQIYNEIFGRDRFKKLSDQGARTQRLLWASTGTKNSEYSDVKYIEALIGPDTVNTVPVETVNAYRDHGEPQARLEQDAGEAALLLKRLPTLGIDLDQITQQLEDEGVEKFNQPFDKLMAALAVPRENKLLNQEPLMKTGTLTPELLNKMDAYWRAANYLSVGQLYLRDNPLLRRPLEPTHVKSLLLGHWGTTPGQNFIYVHLNRVIKKYDLDMIYISGPGHGGPALVGSTYLEGTYSEVYPEITQDEAGLKKLFKQFSFPGGIPSHVSPECPGSIHEGGELGYSLSHAFGAAFDNPELIVACVVGDGEAETGPLATAWHSNKFLNPITDGAVLPILHLNGYKIANPAVLARIEPEELEQLFRGYGWTPYFVEGDDPETMHRLMAEVLEKAITEIRQIQSYARENNSANRPRWPMIVLRSPKGWTGPKEVDGVPNEGTFRSHQIPVLVDADHPGHLKLLEAWLKSYKPEELFDKSGRLIPELAELAPQGERRMGANPHANGGLLLQDLNMPAFQDYAVDVPSPGSVQAADTHELGEFLREVITLNQEQRNFRIFGPDETLSNRLGDVFEVTNRQWNARTKENDEFLATDGRVMEVLSEHQCEGWLEGYLLTGRHGLFNCYEAFIHIIDSMFNQHAKWLKVSAELPWRRKIASLNYLLASHVWQQAHNGFTHQDPGFIDHVMNKKASVVRIYLPPDANCLLSVWDHCLRSRHYVNVVIAGKYQAPQWLSMDEAVGHCTKGIGIWEWAGSDQNTEPDVVMACCGDVPTLETLAAVSILRKNLPELKIRVINVVDLMKLQPQSEHPHGLSDDDFDALFTKNKPIVFAFHGYPWLVHRLTYRRTNHKNMHVRGYKEEGTITTYFDMTVLNDLDRFHLVTDVIHRLPKLGTKGEKLKKLMEDKLVEHKQYINEHGRDMPEVRDWKWGAQK